MLRMRVVQAHEGDSFLLLYGKPRRALLCDGGPRETFDPHLLEALKELKVKQLDCVILSHIDNDHVIGLLDLLAHVRDEKAAGQTPLVEVADLWLNEFDTTIDPAGTIATRLAGVVQNMSAQSMSMSVASAALAGVAEGHKLNVLAKTLGIPVNAALEGKRFIASGNNAFPFHGLTVRVVGPTQANLDELRKKWEEWLDKQETLIEDGKPQLAAMADKSVPNLSSIQLLIEADGKRMLLTGDGRGDHLLQGLDEAGLLDEAGRIEVDILKVPHHGSDRNVTRSFFEKVRAKTYVISADGKNGNPDLPTLQWIVESRPEGADPITIVVTNAPPTVKKLQKAFPPKQHGYKLVVRKEDRHYIDVQWPE